MKLSTEEVGNYHKLLESELARLAQEMEDASKPQDFGDDTDDMDEEADEGEATANKLALAQTIRERIIEIESALHRCASGTYGVCLGCGNDISEEVLETAPESALCVECKKKSA